MDKPPEVKKIIEPGMTAKSTEPALQKSKMWLYLAVFICIAGLVIAGLAAQGLSDKKDGCECSKVKKTRTIGIIVAAGGILWTAYLFHRA